MVYRRRRQSYGNGRRIRYTVSDQFRANAARIRATTAGGPGMYRRLRGVYRSVGRPRVFRRRAGALLSRYPEAVGIVSALAAQAPCASDWLRSILAPWSGPLNACNPYLPPVYTERMRAFIRTTTAAAWFNGSGNAIIVGRPMVANSSPAIYRSTAAGYANDSTDLSTAAPTGINNNSMYVTGDFGDGLNAAGIVSMGMRIRYIGPAELMQGQYFFYESQAHTDCSAATITEILAQQACVSLPVSTEWQSIIWSGPQHNSEFAYQSNMSGFPFVAYQLVINIRGVADPLAQFFAVEWFGNFEVLGKTARGAVYSEQNQVAAGVAFEAVQRKAGGTTLTNTPGTATNTNPSIEEADAFLGGSRSKSLFFPFLLLTYCRFYSSRFSLPTWSVRHASQRSYGVGAWY